MFQFGAGTTVYRIYTESKKDAEGRRSEFGEPKWGALRKFTEEESMHPRLAETMDYVEDKRKELLESFAGVPSASLCRRSSADGWSVAEILDHLSIVEAGIARLITKRTARAREAGLGEERSTESVLGSFNQQRATLDNAIMQAPATVHPRANVDIKEALQELESSREALRAAAVAADGLSLGEIKHTHPFLGELDLYQWLIFIGQHEGRHRKQIQRTLNSIRK